MVLIYTLLLSLFIIPTELHSGAKTIGQKKDYTRKDFLELRKTNLKEVTDKYNEAMIYASRIARTNKLKAIFLEVHDKHDPADMRRIDAAFRNLSDSVGCKYGVVVKDNYLDSAMPIQQDYTFLADNKYDYSERSKSPLVNTDLVVEGATIASTVRTIYHPGQEK